MIGSAITIARWGGNPSLPESVREWSFQEASLPSRKCISYDNLRLWALTDTKRKSSPLRPQRKTSYAQTGSKLSNSSSAGSSVKAAAVP